MKIDSLQKFVEDALQIPITILNDDNLIAFEKAHCFIKEVQINYRSEYITFCRSAIKDCIFYEIKDLLNTHCIIFKFLSECFLAGPFVELPWEDGKAEELLVKLKLPSIYLIPLKIYYCGFQKISVQTVIRIIEAAIHNFFDVKEQFSHRILAGQHGDDSLEYDIEIEENFALVEKRYHAENNFIKSFNSGDVKETIKAQKQMRSMGAGISYWMTEKYSSEAATVVRTLCRKAAEEAGVSILVIDAISQEYAQKCGLNRDARKITAIIDEMVIRFANAVAESKAAYYSYPVRKTVDYINLHLSNELSMKELSNVSGISQGHLSKLFKLETELTTSGYITKVRCEKAAELLLRTSISVQDIAAFVGYIDNNYFVKVFKKWSGKSPTTYRKMQV